ncbi:MAG TPA: ATP-grasp domain-containing protein [Longimicrobium sp.]|nr:ATP-grasp domain-containing protein [Longimicrobium sp.]
MSRGEGRAAVLFIESNTSGTGRLFVRTARGMGFAPVLVTARPEKYAFLAEEGAPEVIRVPRTDEDALYALIQGRFGGAAGIVGITSSSEYHVATAAALAARFGLPGPDAGSVRAARDKSHQRRVLAAGGVPTPAFRVVGSAAEAVGAAGQIGFPVVVKPLDGSGSVGVRACADADEVDAHASRLFAPADAEPRVLVEQLVAGDEYSVEVFSGRVIGITRKHLGRPPFFVEAGHDYPAAVAEDVAEALAESVVRGTELLGLGWGPLHWELRMQGGRAYPIEVNPRLAGGFIPELVRHAQGIDLIRETLRLVVGRAPGLEAMRHEHASIRFLFAPRAGRLAEVRGRSTALGLPHVLDVAMYRRAGDELAIEGDFRDRVGHVVSCAERPEAARGAAERARDSIRIRVEEPVDAVAVIDAVDADEVDDAVDADEAVLAGAGGGAA